MQPLALGMLPRPDFPQPVATDPKKQPLALGLESPGHPTATAEGKAAKPFALGLESPESRGPSGDDRLRQAAGDLEATFLSEMLKPAGFDAARESFGGGEGEDQFSSFLRQAQAEQMVTAGGIGLAERLFEALKGRGDGAL